MDVTDQYSVKIIQSFISLQIRFHLSKLCSEVMKKKKINFTISRITTYFANIRQMYVNQLYTIQSDIAIND